MTSFYFLWFLVARWIAWGRLGRFTIFATWCRHFHPQNWKAAHSLYNLLNVKFEGGIQDIKAISDRLRFYNEQHDLFAKRLVKFFTGQFGEIVNSSRSSSSSISSQSGSLSSPATTKFTLSSPAYKSLILLCRHQSPQEHLEICTQYQNALGTMISKDLARMFETLRNSHLIKRPNSDPTSRTNHKRLL